MKIEGILCDLDDTCLSEDGANKAAYNQASESVAKKYKLDADLLTSHVHQISKKLWQDSFGYSYGQLIGFGSTDGLSGEFSIPHPEVDIFKLNALGPILRYRAWINALERFHCNDENLAQEIALHFPEIRRQTFYPYPGVVTTLKQLASRYPLAIVTNGVNKIQMDKVKACGLDKVTDISIVSERVGVGKPHSLIFEIALEKLGINREKVVMIGDSLKSDIAGAQKVGIGRTVWVTDQNTINTGEIQPDFRINSLIELPTLLLSVV